MYRVLILGLVALSTAGCSINSSSLTAGYNNDTQASSPSSLFGGLGFGSAKASDPRNREPNQKVARLDDRVPPGSFEKAPRGALADRDYTQTKLEIERARSLINEYRKKNGLKPLSLNAQLTAAAKAHSLDLAKWDRISHYGSDGSNPWDRVKRAGYSARVAAENVGTGQASIEEVFKGWQESPGHNKNLLLADARDMGIALVRDPKTEFKTFWTLVLGSKK